MKTYKTILMLLLAATTACSKDSAEPDTPGPKPSISMTLDYQSREYELGEVIEATLTITEKNPAADYFLLNTSCNGGTLSSRSLINWLTSDTVKIYWPDVAITPFCMRPEKAEPSRSAFRMWFSVLFLDLAPGEAAQNTVDEFGDLGRFVLLGDRHRLADGGALRNVRHIEYLVHGHTHDGGCYQ